MVGDNLKALYEKLPSGVKLVAVSKFHPVSRLMEAYDAGQRRFGENRPISGIVVFFSPFFMPLLFLLAGIGTRYSLQKRTMREYIAERVKKLLLPSVHLPFYMGRSVPLPAPHSIRQQHPPALFRHCDTVVSCDVRLL